MKNIIYHVEYDIIKKFDYDATNKFVTELLTEAPKFDIGGALNKINHDSLNSFKYHSQLGFLDRTYYESYVPSAKIESLVKTADFFEKVKVLKSFYASFSFDSVLVREEDLKMGQKRLLEVDNRLILPVNVLLRFVITSTDVLHS